MEHPKPNLSQPIQDLQNKIYFDILDKYWSPEIHHVNQEYRTIPQPNYPEVIRSDQHYSDVQGSIHDVAGDIETWSAFQKYKKVHGDEAASAIVTEFLEESKKIMGGQVEATLRAQYFMLLACKP